MQTVELLQSFHCVMSFDFDLKQLKESQNLRDIIEYESVEKRLLLKYQKEINELEQNDFEKRINELNELESNQLKRRQVENYNLARTQLIRQHDQIKDLEKKQLDRRLRLRKATELKNFWRSKAELEQVLLTQYYKNQKEEHIYETVDEPEENYITIDQWNQRQVKDDNQHPVADLPLRQPNLIPFPGIAKRHQQ